MIAIKTNDEIRIMRKAGEIAKSVKLVLLQKAQAGVNSNYLDQLAEKIIKKNGAQPSFKGYRGFPKSIVTCVNEEIVHGIPSERKLAAGDLLTIDLGVYLKGLHVDTAETFEVGGWRLEVGKESRGLRAEDHKFLETGRKALAAAISQCVEGKRVGDISHAMQEVIEKAGYNVVRAFVGHGIGKNLHEEPQIPCFGNAGQGLALKENMTLAIEVMYVQGVAEVEILGDGWTVVTKDNKLSAMLEETVVVGKSNPLVLT